MHNHFKEFILKVKIRILKMWFKNLVLCLSKNNDLWTENFIHFLFWEIEQTYFLFAAIFKNRQQISKLVLCDKSHFQNLTNLNIGLIFLYIITQLILCPLAFHLLDRFFFVNLNCITNYILRLYLYLRQCNFDYMLIDIF